MSWQDALATLDRSGGRSITQQIVDLVASAIASGELQPGEQLPTVRALAGSAGINQLTAARCYRRLQDQGLIVASVGRGTFVRSTPAAELVEGDCSWQVYALPAAREARAGAGLAAGVAEDSRGGVIALSLGSLAEELIPVHELAAAATDVLAGPSPPTFAYTAVEGEWELREQLAALGREHGHEDSAEEVVVTTGASQALTLVARAVLRPGDVAACESPSFSGIVDALRATGAQVLPVPVDEDGLRVDALEQLLRSTEIKLLALQPRLQNPTGRDLDGARGRRLVELAQRRGFFVLEDAVYAPLRFEGVDPGPLRPLDPTRVIHVNSLSKTLSPGLRIGWAAARGPVLDRIVAEKREADMTSATLTQQLAARHLAGGGQRSLIKRASALYAERRDALLTALEREMTGLARWSHPVGGGHLWLTLQRPRAEAALYRAAIEHGVSYVPGAAALVEAPEATHLRLSFGALAPELIAEGVRRLAAAVRAQPQTGRRDTRPAV